MKKILFGALIAGVALADDGTVANERTMDGFYAGLGLLYSHSENKIIGKDGVDALGTAFTSDIDISKKIDKFGGSFVIGYGKLFSRFYIGGEVLCDIAGNKNINESYVSEGNNYPYYAQVRGIVPSIAARLGYHMSGINSLLYTKFGVAFMHTEFQEKAPDAENNVRKMNKAAPLIGVGFEKNICNHFNMRGEFEYRFRVKNTSLTRVPRIAQYNVENRISGFTLRLMATYCL